MKIKENEIKEIQVVTEDNELIASITDDDVIGQTGYKVMFAAAEKEKRERELIKKVHRSRYVEPIHVRVEIMNGEDVQEIEEEITKTIQKLKSLVKNISFEIINEDRPELLLPDRNHNFPRSLMT